MAHAATDDQLQTESHEDDQDCIYLTQEQYESISELGRDPRYMGGWAKRMNFPSWQALTEGIGGTFNWVAYSGYLGTLRFGLEAKGVEGGRELHQRIVSIWERQFRSKIETQPFKGASNPVVNNPLRPTPLHLKMVFCHLGGGWFRARIDFTKLGQLNIGTKKQLKKDAKTELQRLASDAFLVNHSRISDRRGWSGQANSFKMPVQHLPGCEPVDQERDLQKTEGFLSMGFNKELKKTVAYVTQLMEEEEGEAVKWEILRGDLQSKGHPYSDFFGIVGQALDDHIEKFGSSLLESERPKPVQRRELTRPKRRKPDQQNSRKRKAEQGTSSVAKRPRQTEPAQPEGSEPAQHTEVVQPEGSEPAQQTEVVQPEGSEPAQQTEVVQPEGSEAEQQTELVQPEGSEPEQQVIRRRATGKKRKKRSQEVIMPELTDSDSS